MVLALVFDSSTPTFEDYNLNGISLKYLIMLAVLRGFCSISIDTLSVKRGFWVTSIFPPMVLKPLVHNHISLFVLDDLN